MKIYRNIAIATAVFLAACGSGSPSSTTAATPEATTVAPPIAIGKTGKAEGVDFTVTAVATPTSVGPTQIGEKAAAGETFVVVSYTLKNTATKALTLMERPGLTLIDPSGQSYEQDMLAAGIAATSDVNDISGMASDLNSNISAKSKAAWKVDKAAFDRGTWRLVVATDPALTFALK